MFCLLGSRIGDATACVGRAGMGGMPSYTGAWERGLACEGQGWFDQRECSPLPPRTLSCAYPAGPIPAVTLTLVGAHPRTPHAPTHSARTDALRTHPRSSHAPRTSQREFASPLNSQADARRAARPPPCIPSDTASPGCGSASTAALHQSAPSLRFAPRRAAVSAQLGPPLRVRCPRDP